MLEMICFCFLFVFPFSAFILDYLFVLEHFSQQGYTLNQITTQWVIVNKHHILWTCRKTVFFLIYIWWITCLQCKMALRRGCASFFYIFPTAQSSTKTQFLRKYETVPLNRHNIIVYLLIAFVLLHSEECQPVAPLPSSQNIMVLDWRV